MSRDPAPVAALTWYEGPPPFPQDQEWFIAETVYGDRVVLRSLDEGREHKHTYDFKTADGTYMASRIIRRWMQFPDCEYLPPDIAAPVAQPLTDAQVEAIVREASKGAAIRRDGTTSTRIVRLTERAHGITGNAAPVAQPAPQAWVDKVMEQAQVFASSWSLVGGRFDDGTQHEQALQEKEALRAMLAAGPGDAKIDTTSRET